MSMNIQIKITGDKETIRKLNKLGQSLVTFDMAMRDIGKRLTNYFSNDVFASQGGVLGEKWAKLASSTIKAKSKKYLLSGQMPLVATGKMKNSFIFESDRNSVVITNSADYFAYHQSNEPRTRLPRRVMMKVTPGIKGMIKDIIDADIQSKIRKARL